MIIRVEAIMDSPNGEKMVITKKVTVMSNLNKAVESLREACKIWEFGPKKESKSPPQSSP